MKSRPGDQGTEHAMVKSKLLLIFSQTFVPDPASVGQHMTDVAAEMARRGYRVRVYTSAVGYEDPSVRYPRRETLRGIDVRRLPFSGFGKKRLWLRAFGTLTFLFQCFWLALFTPRVAGVFFTTSPPMGGLAPCLARIIRRYPVAYWAMDLNPDQLIAMGKIKETSFTARMIEAVNRFILRSSSLIVALDRFMADRLNRRGNYAGKMLVMPPWPHEDHMTELTTPENDFRREHDLSGTFILMYSGNHSPANPLKTVLEAAVRLKDEPRLRFLFVGGGLGKKEVEQYKRDHQLDNVISLPYQPLERLGQSLGCADVHIVSLGDNMVGIIHPCKIYGAMAVGRPILFLGPQPSHVSDILEENPIGWRVVHGDVDGMVAAIHSAMATAPDHRAAMGQLASRILHERLSQSVLCNKFCDHLESALRLSRRANPHAQPAIH